MDTSNVLEHLAKRRDYCRGLLDLSRRQREFIADGNYTELLEVVSRKQRLLGRLDALKQEQPEVVTNWNHRRHDLPEDIRGGCETLLKDIGETLRVLLEEEQFCTDRLTERRDDTRRQLSEITNGRSANNAYDTPGEEKTHRYLDLNQ